MTESHPTSSSAKPSLGWLSAVAFLGVVLGVVLVNSQFGLVLFAPKAPIKPQVDTRPPATRSVPKPEEIAKPHLHRAEQEAARVIDEHLRKLDDFFAQAKKNTHRFAEEALGWGSKFRLIQDSLGLSDGNKHKRFLQDRFEAHFFTPDQLKEEVQKVVQSYLAHLRDIESKMLVALRADLDDFSTDIPIVQLDDRVLQQKYDQAISQIMEATGHDLGANIGVTIVSVITGEVMAHVAIRLGVSAGILGTGASSTWATLGAGLVASIIVESVVSWVWDAIADPRGKLVAELNKKLDEVHRLIADGSSDGKGLRQQLHELAQKRAVVRRQAVLSLLQPNSLGAK